MFYKPNYLDSLIADWDADSKRGKLSSYSVVFVDGFQAVVFGEYVTITAVNQNYTIGKYSTLFTSFLF